LEEHNFPAVTVVTVNFNGKRFLNNLFKSIEGLSYPKDKINTVMVDNGSSDGSSDFVHRSFPWVKTVNLEKNSGYAGGNNEGFKAAGGKYVALINNDCTVDKNWLSSLVRRAGIETAKGVKTGAVSSKVLFYYSYIPLVIIPVSGEIEISQIRIEGHAENGDLLKSIKFLSGCRCVHNGGSNSSSSWRLADYALIGFPVPDTGCDTVISMDIKHIQGSSDVKFYIKKLGNGSKGGQPADICHCEDLFPVAETEAGVQQKRVEIIISKNMYCFKNDIINSCGLELNHSFYARDRGGNSFDLGQYDDSAEVFAPSGSSFLINREMLSDTGVFEQSFFTYYEDMDLFWRARLKGWKVFYEPASIARHIHCGTGKEWSYSFTYHVLRNRLLAIFRNGWFALWIKNIALFYISAAAHTAFYIAGAISGSKQQRPDIKARLKIMFELFYMLPAQSAARYRIRNKRKVADSEIKKLLVNF